MRERTAGEKVRGMPERTVMTRFALLDASSQREVVVAVSR